MSEPISSLRAQPVCEEIAGDSLRVQLEIVDLGAISKPLQDTLRRVAEQIGNLILIALVRSGERPQDRLSRSSNSLELTRRLHVGRNYCEFCSGLADGDV